QVMALGDGGTILQTAGVAPTITQPPTFGYDSAGQPYVEGAATGDGPLKFFWLQNRGNGLPVPLGTSAPRQLIAGPPASPTAGPLLSSPVHLCVVNPFGLVLSQPVFPARFLDLSARATVGADENILIGGFSIAFSGGLPTTPHAVLVRAVGPALAGFGV